MQFGHLDFDNLRFLENKRMVGEFSISIVLEFVVGLFWTRSTETFFRLVNHGE